MEHVIRPVAERVGERIRSHFGVLNIEGVEIEIMGALRKRLPGGGWEAPVDVASLRRWADRDGLRIPVMDLAHEARAYELLGRHDRAALLRRAVDEAASFSARRP